MSRSGGLKRTTRVGTQRRLREGGGVLTTYVQRAKDWERKVLVDMTGDEGIKQALLVPMASRTEKSGPGTCITAMTSSRGRSWKDRDTKVMQFQIILSKG